MKKFTMAAGVGGLIAALSAHAMAEEGKPSQTAKQRQSDKSNQSQAANRAQADPSQRSKAGEKTSGEPVVVAVTTVAFAESTGCWAKIHDGENFTGRTLTVMGAQALPNLEFGIGADWEGDIDSVEVGPKGKLTLYDDENFADDPRNLGPNARVADIHQALFDEGIESLRLACTDDSSR